MMDTTKKPLNNNLIIPKMHLCPVTGKIMKRPHFLYDDTTCYEYDVLQYWVKLGLNPTTKEPLKIQGFQEAPEIKHQITSFLKQHADQPEVKRCLYDDAASRQLQIKMRDQYIHYLSKHNKHLQEEIGGLKTTVKKMGETITKTTQELKRLAAISLFPNPFNFSKKKEKIRKNRKISRRENFHSGKKISMPTLKKN